MTEEQITTAIRQMIRENHPVGKAMLELYTQYTALESSHTECRQMLNRAQARIAVLEKELRNLQEVHRRVPPIVQAARVTREALRLYEAGLTSGETESEPADCAGAQHSQPEPAEDSEPDSPPRGDAPSAGQHPSSPASATPARSPIQSLQSSPQSSGPGD